MSNRSVTERLFRGFCQPEFHWESLFVDFEKQQEAIFSLLEKIPDLQSSDREITGSYLKEFFTELDLPNRHQETVVEACRPRKYG